MRALFVLLPLSIVASDSISDAERQKALDYLEQTRAKLVSDIAELSPAQ